MNAVKPAFNTVPEASGILNIPQRFLRQEIAANRVPHLRVGRRILLDLDAVRQALVERSRAGMSLATLHG